jgi:RNA polymerase sigma-70 factor (ECF subfamily)
MSAPGNVRPDQSRREAFSALYEEFMPKVYKYIAYRVADTPAAEDVTTLVFEKALTKFDTFQRNKASFATWIFTIARNSVIDHYRLRRPAQSLDAEDAPDLPDRSSSPAEAIEKAEDISRLHYCLERLSQPEQDILSLKFGAEFSNRDIAGQIKLSESNIGIIIFRAVRKLRNCFEKWGHE